MKRTPPTHSLPCKVTAITLFLFTLLASVLGVVGIVVSAVYGIYDGASVDDLRAQLTEDYLYSLSYGSFNEGIYVPGHAESIAAIRDTPGLYLEITDADGNVILSTYTGQSHVASSETSFFLSDKEYTRFLNRFLGGFEETQDPSAETTGEDPAPVTSASGEAYETDSELVTSAPEEETPPESPERTNRITVRFWGTGDLLAGWRNTFFRILSLLARYPLTVIISTVFSVLAAVFLFIFLLCSAGHRRSCDEVKENPVDTIPYDLFAAICGFAEFGLIFLFLDILVLEARDVFALFVLGSLALYVPAALILLGFFMSTATRVKTGRIWRNTLIWMVIGLVFRFFRWMGRSIKTFFREMSLVRRTVITLALLAVGNLIFIMIFSANPGLRFPLVVGLLIEGVILTVVILRYAVALRRLEKTAHEIAGGNLDAKLELNGLPDGCIPAARDLNSIGEGLSHAVDERMKSERFKTELITNVSHDIKTPLTSIINYVDLIKKENVTEEPLAGYVDVLDRQSARLKKLIEDLVEASKASSGVLTVQLFPCELGVLLSQLEGEYRDKLEEAGLTLCVSCPETPLTVMADGRHLGRVFDNLMSNARKYAQPGTRVYVDAADGGDGTAVITFRNVSGAPLNIPAEELLERFVRGDASRHTEGSGLGLSIVQSLTELQKGQMTLTIDGDLFKVRLAFPLAGENAAQ